MPSNPIPRKAFAAKIQEALRAEGAPGEYVFDELENTLTHPGRPAFHLETHYLEAQNQPPYQLEQLTRVYADHHLRPPTQPATWEEARKVVFPYVRPKAFHAHRAFRRLQGEDLPEVPHGVVSEHVTVCIGTPAKKVTLPASVADLARWGVTLEETLAVAHTNVERRGVPPWQESKEFPGVYRSPWRDEYGISRLLFPAMFRPLALRGDPVIIAPSWQTFLVADSASEQGLVNLGRFGRKLTQTDNFLMYRPLRARGDALEHWLPPEGHPAHGPLRFLQLMNEGADYAEQAQVGRRFFQRQERPSNIPVPQVFTLHGGAELGMLATWREGPPCALPEVDYVAFVRKSESLGMATWADVNRVLGKELEPMGTYPPRWLARTFPADWQLSSLNLVPWSPSSGPG